jgi:hypothetical protein
MNLKTFPNTYTLVSQSLLVTLAYFVLLKAVLEAATCYREKSFQGNLIFVIAKSRTHSEKPLNSNIYNNQNGCLYKNVHIKQTL